MNMSNPSSSSGRNDSGAAIIIVLGMLALLLILASAFSVNMRVERTAAGNARFGVSTRHMLLAALARAIADIDANMTNAAGPTVYPVWDVIGTQGGQSGAQLAWGEALQYVPGALHSQLSGAQCSWKEFPGSRGRYAYLIANVSGFLDANEVGGASRGLGLDPDEIGIGALSDVVSTSLFFSCRNADVRYETLKEFGELQMGTGLSTNGLPTNFVVYSRYPYGGSPLAELEGDCGVLYSRRTAIRQAFQASGLSASEALYAYLNLMDYVDTDNLPGNENGNRAPRFDRPFVEAVPMLNEVWCRGKFVFATNAAGGYDCSGRYRVRVECAYPFINPPMSNGFECGISISSPGGAYAPNANPYSNQYTIASSATYWQRTIITPSSGGLGFNAGNVGNLTGGQVINVSIAVDGKVFAGTAPVDEIRTPIPITLQVVIPQNPPGVFTNYATAGKECIDPRMNHSPAAWVPARTNAGIVGTLGSVNAAVAAAIAADPTLDRDQWMYIRNDGQGLETVGEVGRLFYGRSLETIRLYDQPVGSNNLHTVLDHFAMNTNSTSLIRKGLVHVSTRHPEVIHAVWTNMPVRPGVPLNDPTVLQDIAAALQAAGPYTNLSGIGRADWTAASANMGSLPVNPPLCDLDREALISNTSGMLGVRQNLFVILLAAGPFRISPGIAAFRGDWLGRSRAVALVWRDPYPDGNGNYPCFVRTFNVLKDD